MCTSVDSVNSFGTQGCARFADLCANSCDCFSHSTMEVGKTAPWKTVNIHPNEHTPDIYVKKLTSRSFKRFQQQLILPLSVNISDRGDFRFLNMNK